MPKTTLQPNPKLKGKLFKQKGPVTSAEQALVTQVVQDSPFAVTPKQERALAVVLRRPKDVVKAMVEEARQTFVERADRYVDIHMEATEAALRDGTPKGLEQAVKASQWALANISTEGARIVDKVQEQTSGMKIMIGLKVGGKNENTPIEAIAVKE